MSSLLCMESARRKEIERERERARRERKRRGMRLVLFGLNEETWLAGLLGHFPSFSLAIVNHLGSDLR